MACVFPPTGFSMATVSERPSPTWIVAQLREHFGMIPARRIRLDPSPGSATEKDLIHLWDYFRIPSELMDGVLVEKAGSVQKSFAAQNLLRHLYNYLEENDRGIVVGLGCPFWLKPGQVRMPDVSFFSWEKLPGGEVPDVEIAPFRPDLAVEILTNENTPKEMRRKSGEYIDAGIKLVWLVHLGKKTVQVLDSFGKAVLLQHQQTIEGSPLLPGFSLPLVKLFAWPRCPPRR